MGKLLRRCLQSTLKIVNSFITMAGLAMILYSLWMLKEWKSGENASFGPGRTFVERPIQGGSFMRAASAGRVQLVSGDLPSPWFIYTFLGMGIFLCLIACSGHIAAETTNGHCLSCYMAFVFLLFLLEAGVAVDIFFNKNWEEDIPEDPTGKLDQLKNFVRENIELCKWLGLVALIVQALSVLLSMILRSLGPDLGRDYDSDDDYVLPRPDLRQPFLKLPASPANAAPEPRLSQNDAWSTKIREKMNR